ncbi:MAG: efflux RND transporter periplasmic adaptor subunit [Bacteroidales bacterium]|nr:efflux RND transporter periplasmic adaptor subunit [Bacteroidales bacterium]
MNTGKTLKIVLVLAVVLIALAFVGKRKGWFGKAETVKVSVEQAKNRTIVETINGNGKIHPEKEVKITPDVSGEVVGLYVKEGEGVTKGTLLAKIKPDTYLSIKARAEAALNSVKARQTQTEANLTQARLSFNRSKTLWEQKTISQSDYEQAEATYKMAAADVASAKASVRSAEASLNEADENLFKTTLYAPIDGTIYGLSIEQGERVVGTALMSGTEMMRIADLSIMEVVVEINENDVVRVSYGDTAMVEVDAYMDHKFKGVVTEIANSASTSGVSVDQVTSFNVKILLLQESYLDLISEGSPSPFRPGMSATVDIQTESKFDILSIPIQAVTTRTDTLGNENEDEDIISNSDDEEKVVVFVLSDDEKMTLQREVKTGIQDNNYIELMEGIDEDDKVIVAPYSAVSKKLSDSTLVEVVSKKDLFNKKKKKK